MGRKLLRTIHIILFVAILTISNAAFTQATFRDSSSFYTNSLSEKLVPRYSPMKKMDIPILVYHYVEYVADKNDPTRKLLSTEPHILDGQILSLLSAGYTFVNFNDLSDYFEGKALPPEHPVILTFDDGYEDFYTDVMPIIKKYNVKAVQYIITDVIGSENYMNDSQLREVINTGLIEIGAHTRDHFNLLNLTRFESYAQIMQSKTYLEQEYGVEVPTFAYPYGHYNPSIARQAEEAGFDFAVTMDRGYIASRSSKFTLKRIRPGIELGTSLVTSLRAVDK